MNWNMYRLERKRLIEEGVAYPLATDQAYEYVQREESKEGNTLNELTK